MADRPVVLVYRERLLGASEPWLPGQGERLERYVPWYLGLRHMPNPALPQDRVLMLRQDPMLGPARRLAWKRWTWPPRLLRQVRSLEPVVLHAHFGRDAVQVLPLARRLGIPLVVTFHGQDATRWDFDFAAGRYSDRLYLQRREELMRTAARVLAVSTFVRTEVVARGFPPDLVQVHYIGVDVDAVARAAAPTEPRLVVFAGRLIGSKGCDDLLDAVALVEPRCRLVVLGDGEDRYALEARARGLGVDATFLGARPQAEVWEWLGRATVVAVPSKTAPSGWAEAFGLVCAEAQAAGTPVVAYDCGGIGEAVLDGIGGIVVPEGDIRALTNGLARLLGDGALTERMGEAGRRWVSSERSLTMQSHALEDIYDEVTGRDNS